MSTQVQHRRGTAAQHDAFTGAMSEITHDTTNNNLRVHDGNKPGGYATLMEDQLGVAGGVATLDSTGNVPEAQLGNVPKSYDYASTSALAESEVPAAITYVRTAGYSAAGDGGAALYIRVLSEPSHAGKVQSADGAWWEYTPEKGIANVKCFGAKGDGANDDTEAFQQAILYVVSLGKGTVYLPNPSVHYLVGALTLYASVSIVGADKYNTKIRPLSPSATIFSGVNSTLTYYQAIYSSFCIDCWDVAGVTGFDLAKCYDITIRDIFFSGCEVNFTIDQGANYDVLDCHAISTPYLKVGRCYIGTTDDAQYIHAVNLMNYKLENTGPGSQGPCISIYRGVGVHVFNARGGDHWEGGGVDFIVIRGGEGNKVSNSGCGASRTAIVLGASGGTASATPSWTEIAHCDFDQAHDNAIQANAAKFLSIIGGNYTGHATSTGGAIYLNGSGVSDVIITGATLQFWSAGSGVAINGSSRVKVSGCTISNNLNVFQVVNNPTYVQMFNNTGYDCTNKFSGGSSITGIGNAVRDNPGVNPLPVPTPATQTSGEDYRNDYGVDCTVGVGSASAVWVNGINMGIGSGVLQLRAGDTIRVDHGGSYGWTWVGH